MPNKPVTGKILHIDGSPVIGVAVTFNLVGDLVTEDLINLRGPYTVTTESNGTFSTTIPVPDSGTVQYLVILATGLLKSVYLGGTDPITLSEIMDLTDIDIPQDQMLALIAAHEAKLDPHSVYFNEERGDLRYALIGSGGGSGDPAGLNMYVQFNDNGVFGGDENFVWDKNTGCLEIRGRYHGKSSTQNGESGVGVQIEGGTGIHTGSDGGSVNISAGCSVSEKAGDININGSYGGKIGSTIKITSGTSFGLNAKGGNLELSSGISSLYKAGDIILAPAKSNAANSLNGRLYIKKPNSTFTVDLSPDNLTSNRVLTFPNADGTIALFTDIPTNLSQLQPDGFHETVSSAQKNSWNGKISAVIADSPLSGSGTSESHLTIDLSGKADVGDIPTSLSELSDDTTHRLVTDTEKGSWNGKADIGDIPTTLSALSDDTTHRLVTDSEKSSWNTKAEVGDIPTSLADLSDDSTHRLVTDSEKEKWNNSGTTFPTSPQVGDRYFRKDLGFACFWDGQFWLTENEYPSTLPTGYWVSEGYSALVTTRSDYRKYYTHCSALVYVASPCDVNNYWTFALGGSSITWSFTLFLSPIDNQADAYIKVDSNPLCAYTWSDTMINWHAIPTGSPGAGQVLAGTIYYRLIIAGNIVMNGGFEEGNPPTQWTGDNNPVLTIVNDPRPGSVGNLCVDLEVGAGKSYGQLSQDPPIITPGATYQLDYWVKNIDQIPLAYVVYDASWNILAIENPYTTGTGWEHKQSASFVPPTNLIHVSFYATGVAGNHVRYDDINVSQV
jgi:hypothetical protein